MVSRVKSSGVQVQVLQPVQVRGGGRAAARGATRPRQVTRGAKIGILVSRQPATHTTAEKKRRRGEGHKFAASLSRFRFSSSSLANSNSLSHFEKKRKLWYGLPSPPTLPKLLFFLLRLVHARIAEFRLLAARPLDLTCRRSILVRLF